MVVVYFFSLFTSFVYSIGMVPEHHLESQGTLGPSLCAAAAAAAKRPRPQMGPHFGRGNQHYIVENEAVYDSLLVTYNNLATWQ